MSASTKDLLNRFIKIDQQIKKKEGEVDQLKEDLAALEAQLLPRFQEAGMAAMRSTSKVTVYIRRDLWAGARDKNKALLCEAIKEVPEIADMVQENVNSQTLSSYVRERAREHFGDDMDKKSPEDLVSALPVPLQAAIVITEKYSLRTRKS